MKNATIGRRLVLQSLATGAGVAAFATGASAAAGHHAHYGAVAVAPATTPVAPAAHVFLDDHSFDTLATLSDQIVPGARGAQVPEFLDRLLAVESLDTQKGFIQAIGAFEREARASHGKPWKALSAEQANALLTKMSTMADGEGARGAFEDIKGAVSDAYFTTEAGRKDLGWDGSVTFAPPGACENVRHG
jgi:hypothetical protein